MVDFDAGDWGAFCEGKRVGFFSNDERIANMKVVGRITVNVI